MDEMSITRANLTDLHDLGWTQQVLAEEIGISQAVVSRLLRGTTTRVNASTAEKLREFFARQDVRETLEGEALTEDEVRKAIRLYKYLRRETEQGARLILQQDGIDRLLVALF